MERKFTEEEKEILEDCTNDLKSSGYFEDQYFGRDDYLTTTEELEYVAYDIEYLAKEYLKISKKLIKILEKEKKS